MSIDSPRDVPEHWRPYFESRGIEFTFNALERKAEGVSLNTVIRALTSQGRTTDRVANAVSGALGITSDKFRELRGEPTGEPFQLPARARLLTVTEREVVRSVVNAILDARENTATQSDASPQGRQDQEAGLDGAAQVGDVMDRPLRRPIAIPAPKNERKRRPK